MSADNFAVVRYFPGDTRTHKKGWYWASLSASYWDHENAPKYFPDSAFQYGPFRKKESALWDAKHELPIIEYGWWEDRRAPAPENVKDEVEDKTKNEILDEMINSPIPNRKGYIVVRYDNCPSRCEYDENYTIHVYHTMENAIEQHKDSSKISIIEVELVPKQMTDIYTTNEMSNRGGWGNV